MSKPNIPNDKQPKQGASTPGGKQQEYQSEKELAAGNLNRSDQRVQQSAADTSAAVTGRNRSAGARGDSNTRRAESGKDNLRNLDQKR
jgi:hypothetical protein